jgi:gamma-glutamylaminecyclotransferase
VTIRVFVYGTLKRGFPNHPLLERSQLLGEALTCERWPLLIAGRWFVPCMRERRGEGHRVRGELYAVDAATLEALDELEGVNEPDGYDRRAIEVERGPGDERLEAQAYFKRAPLGAVHSDPLECYDDDRYVRRLSRS